MKKSDSADIPSLWPSRRWIGRSPQLRALARGAGLTRGTAAALWLTVLHLSAAQAQFIWTGNGATNGWFTDGNWQGNSVPTSSASTQIEFRLNPNNGAPVQNIASPFALNRLTFADTWNGSLLSGFGISFNDDGMASPLLVFNNANQTINNNLILNALTVLSGTSAGTLTLNGVLSGTGGLNQNGAYTTFLSSANTFTGNTQILNGTLRIGNALALQNSTVFIGANGTLDITGFAATIGGLSGVGALNLGTQRLATGGNNANTMYSGNLLGGNGGRIDHVGTGTLRLVGGNSEMWALRASSGEVRVEGGTLRLNSATIGGDAALVASLGNITLSDGAVVSGSNVFGSSVIVQGLSLNPTLTVEGANTRLHSFNNIRLGFNSGQSGTMIVRDGGTVDTIGNLFVGEAGSGTLQILSGGSLTTASAGVGVGFLHGEVLVQGTGSLLNVTDSLNISSTLSGASGSLSVSQGGEVRVGSLLIMRPSSSVTVDNGTLIAGRITSSSSGSGTISLLGGTNPNLILRNSNSTINTTFSGLLEGSGTIEMGVNSLWNLTGQNNTFNGTVRFTGGFLTGGDLRVTGDALAHAELDFASGGTFRANSPLVNIRRITGSAGTGHIILGNEPIGANNTLRITGDGTSFDGAITGTSYSRIILDAAPTAQASLGGISASGRAFGGVTTRSGFLSLTGGSWWLSAPGIGLEASILGDGGNLIVDGGATLQAGNAAFALRSGQTSYFTVRDPGTSVRLLGDLMIGATNIGAIGTSRLAILDGSSVVVEGQTYLQGTTFASPASPQNLIVGGSLSTGGLTSLGTSTNFNLRLADPTGGVALEVGRNNQSSTFGGQFVRNTAGAEATVRKIGTGNFVYEGPEWNQVNWNLAGGWTEVGSGLSSSNQVIRFQGGNLRLASLSVTLGNHGGQYIFEESGRIEVNSAVTQSLSASSVLSGPGDLIKSGPGHLTIASRADDFTGTVRIEGGSLRWATWADLVGDVNFHIGPAGSMSFGSIATLFDLSADSDAVLGHLTGSGNLLIDPIWVPDSRVVLTTGDFQGTINGSRELQLSPGGNFVFGGTMDLDSLFSVKTGASLELRSALLGASSVEVEGNLTGSGQISTAHLQFLPGANATASGDLTLGSSNPSSKVQFDEATSLHGSVHTLTFLASSPVGLAETTTLGPGGRLVSANGFLLGQGRRLTAAGAATIEGDFNNQGVVRGPGGDAFLIFENDVTGPGNFEGNIQFNAHYSPGNSPADILFEENLSFASSSTLRLELGGLLAGDEYDVLRILGNLNLGNSTLDIALINSFMPSLGDSFTVLHFGSLTGSFAQINGLDLGHGLWLDAHFSTSALTLTAVPEPSSLLLLALGFIIWAVCVRRTSHSRRCSKLE